MGPSDPNKRKAGQKPSASQTDEAVKLRQAEMLLSISKTLAAFDTLDDMLSTLVAITTQEVGADRGSAETQFGRQTVPDVHRALRAS